MRSRPALLPQSSLSRAGWVDFAQSVRDLLIRERITVEDVAIVLGVCLATARSRWNGQSPWRYDELAAIASLIDIPVSHIVLMHELRPKGVNV